MKRVSVVQYKRGEAGLPDTLTEIARHFQTTWGTAVAEVAENTYLESDAEGNLMVHALEAPQIKGFLKEGWVIPLCHFSAGFSEPHPPTAKQE